LPDEKLQPALVPSELWPPGIEKRLQVLVPVFSTDFDRTLSRIILPANLLGLGQPAACIELALDRGMVSATPPQGPCRLVISEIELELLYGELSTLQAFALAATAGVPVSPCDISKAERGYRLIIPEKLRGKLTVS
jgi:inorganic triphosphatase YgiF